MSDHKNDKALEEYLQGGSELSRRYCAEQQAEPPARLDAAILKAARAAVTRKAAPHSRNWYVPLSLAAVVVIGVSLVFRMYEDKGQQLLTEPAPEQLLDKSSGRDVTGESAATEPAGPPAVTAPLPQALPQMMEKDDMQGEPMQKEISDAPARLRSLEQSPAGISVQPVEDIATPALKMERRVTPEAEMSLSEKKSTLNIQATTAPAESAILSETEWLKNISQMWKAEKKDEAVAGLKQFLSAYPDYPHDEIIRQLPGDFDPATYISGFGKQ